MSPLRAGGDPIARGLTTLCLLWCLSAPLAAAQPVTTAPPGGVQVLGGLSGIPVARLRQVTRDGSRVLMAIATSAGTPTTDVLVLHTASGTSVFDSRTLASPSRRFSDALLTADGRQIVYREQVVDGWLVRARDLGTGAEHDVFLTTRDITLASTNEDASLVTFTDATTLPASIGFAGPMHPAQPLVNPCGPEPVLGPIRLSADGTTGVYQRVLPGSAPYTAPVVFDTRTGAAFCDDRANAGLGMDPTAGFFLDRTGRWLAGTWLVRVATHTIAPLGFLLDRQSGLVVGMPALSLFARLVGLSDDARHVLMPPGVFDLAAQLVTPLAFDPSSVALSGDGGTVVLQLDTPNAVPDRMTRVVHLDADRDGLHDGWETTFGLDPADAGDAAGDPDGDGRSSALEYLEATHPTARPVRYFAEGAAGAFFDTSLGLFNPTASDVVANVRVIPAEGASRSSAVLLRAHSPVSFNPRVIGLPFTEFSLVVESPVPIVAERRMHWSRALPYGSHAGTGVETPSTTWHFAEGATTGNLQTFFLLLNPGPQPATVVVRYLMADATLHVRTYDVPAWSRRTVWVNQEGAPLDAAEFAAIVDASVPVVVERAMYRDAPGELFAAGNVAAGTPTLATSWWFAEGATGDYFDMFLLIGNPGETMATVTATFMPAPAPASGASATIVRSYLVAPHSRRTIWVARDAPALHDTALSTALTSDQPIVAERSMWWPGPTAATWRGSHTEMGAPSTGLRWAVADVPTGYEGAEDTFLLIATGAPTPGTARVSLRCPFQPAASLDVPLPTRRTTVWLRHAFPQSIGLRCAATIESIPTSIGPISTVTPPVPLVVEVARYGRHASGEVSLATRLPDPQD